MITKCGHNLPPACVHVVNYSKPINVKRWGGGGGGGGGGGSGIKLLEERRINIKFFLGYPVLKFKHLSLQAV